MFSPFLAPFSALYYLGLIADKCLKSVNQTQLPKPVISIGNLTWGGTGKTPLQIKLIADLLGQRTRPAVLTRGYAGVGRNNPALGSGENDEVAMMKKYFPTIPFGIGPNRTLSAQKILASYPIDVFILDDGFQHWKMKRDLDIVCIDALDPWGGGHLIPWGHLREPLSGLKRSQVVVITRSELVDEEDLAALSDRIARLARHQNIFTSFFSHQLIDWRGKAVDLNSTLQGARVLAVSAIGNPRSFEKNLETHGAEIIPYHFPDHYPYADSDLIHIEKKMKTERAILVVTEKDETKLRKTRWGFAHGGPADLYVLKAKVQFTYLEEIQWAKIIQRFRRG